MKSKQESNTYSPEFRESAVKLVIESDQSRAATARDLGINVNTLHTWASKYGEVIDTSQQTVDVHLYDEFKQLKKENQQLREERDILKKAAAYFASHQS